MEDSKRLIKALTKENERCQDKAAKLTAKNTSLTNEIKALKKEYAKYQHDNPPIEEMTSEQRKELQLLAHLRAQYEIDQLRKSGPDEKTDKPT